MDRQRCDLFGFFGVDVPGKKGRCRQGETGKSPETSAMLANLNQFLALAMPYMNSCADPDIDKLAMQAGLDPEMAKEAYLQTVKKMREMQKEAIMLMQIGDTI